MKSTNQATACRARVRGLATRYEKRAANYRAMVVIASIAVWLGS